MFGASSDFIFSFKIQLLKNFLLLLIQIFPKPHIAPPFSLRDSLGYTGLPVVFTVVTPNHSCNSCSISWLNRKGNDIVDSGATNKHKHPLVINQISKLQLSLHPV